MRIQSVDIFRGLTILVMIFVNDLAGVNGLPWWTYHMPRGVDGMTYVDAVFPAFLFIVGVSIPLAVAARLGKGDSVLRLGGHIVTRSIALIILGIFLANSGKVDAALTGKPYLPPNWMTFPVVGPVSYYNDFGAPRSGGRTHEGNDILAPRRALCVAVLSGTVTSKTSTLGGKTIYLQADNGWRFYYAHLDGWAVTSGHVRQGQTIGYVGNTGLSTSSHLHYEVEVHGKTVNPKNWIFPDIVD